MASSGSGSGGGGIEGLLAGGGGGGASIPKFLAQTWEMLEAETREGGAVVWSDNGTTLLVRNVQRLEAVVLPRCVGRWPRWAGGRGVVVVRRRGVGPATYRHRRPPNNTLKPRRHNASSASGGGGGSSGVELLMGSSVSKLLAPLLPRWVPLTHLPTHHSCHAFTTSYLSPLHSHPISYPLPNPTLPTPAAASSGTTSTTASPSN